MGRLDDPDYYYKKRLAKQKKALKLDAKIPKYIMQNGIVYEKVNNKMLELKPLKPVEEKIKIIENILVSFK